MNSVEPQDSLYLVGFRIEPDIFEPQLYTIYVNDDRPILYERQPIVFTRPELASLALSRSNCGASAIGPAPTDLYLVLDVADAVYTLSMKDEETTNELLDLINVLLDFVNCIEELMPESYLASLKKLADHLTFNKRFVEYLEKEGIERKTITDAIFWTLGMIVYHMKIVIG